MQVRLVGRQVDTHSSCEASEPIMKTEYSRRSILAGGITLVGTTLIGCQETEVADSDTQPPNSAAPTPDSETPRDETIRTRTASCNCGQLRVTCVGPDPERISLCHCNLCQRQSGSAFAIQARFPREQVTIEGESTAWKFPIEGADPVTYRNCAMEGGEFHFCPVCGSTVYYTADADTARIGVKIGTFADPTFPPPKISGFEEYRHPWAMNLGSLPMEHLE